MKPRPSPCKQTFPPNRDITLTRADAIVLMVATKGMVYAVHCSYFYGMSRIEMREFIRRNADNIRLDVA